MAVTETAEIGIIGGTGVYDQENFEDAKEIKVFTPFGETSDLVSVGDLQKRQSGIYSQTWQKPHDSSSPSQLSR